MNGVAALTLVDWPDTGPGEDGLVPSRLMTVEQALAILRETPNRLARLTGNATQAQLRTSPEPGEWSATEVLAHLRSCADVSGRAIEVILAENHPTLKAVNPTTWIDSTDYHELEFGPSLNAVTCQRAGLLGVLEPLPFDDWSRSATVIGTGKPLDRTVLSYADRLARHERAHWKQVEKTVELVPRGGGENQAMHGRPPSGSGNPV